MKLLRFGAVGAERPGLLDDSGVVRDLSSVVDDIAGAAITPQGLDRLRSLDPSELPAAPHDGRLGPCVAGVRKVLGIGRNYADHAAEMAAAAPSEPLVFSKATSAITGPNDGLILPKGSTHTDWEIELGVVIGTPAQYVSEATALDHVAGYCIVNDVSERRYQKERGGQFVKGKSADTFCPLGPWLVTRDAVPDPQALTLRLSLNGEVRQDGATRDMIFSVAHLVSYLSQFMTLETGDIITTGTPAGVGAGQTPPRFLQSGDILDLEIAGLGRQQHHVRRFEETV
ncbi:MAG: fumarylacetoacetate hydrolase family protein [Pseudomonadota bacterium]